MKMNKVLVIIPARAGSKGLRSKNTKKVCEKPLISYTIEFAKKIVPDNKIIVSSDSYKIMLICKDDNVGFMKRPKELAQDDSKMIDVLKHVLEVVKELPECVILLQPTSPIRKIKTFEKMFKLYQRTQDLVITVKEIDNPRVAEIENKIFLPCNFNIGDNRQAIKPLYNEAGNILIINPKDILRGEYYHRRITPVIINGHETIDIDTKDDVKILKEALKCR